MTATAYLLIAIAGVIGYMLGSIPFGLVLTRLAGMGDIRNVGSGNIGATNVLRTGNKVLALLTLLLDFAKGAAGAWLGFLIAGDNGALLGGFCAFLGHCYPVWLNFRGGKGVATLIGVLLGWAPLAAVLFCSVWLAVAVITRYSSLSALVASVCASVSLLFLQSPAGAATIGFAMTGLLFWRHRANIERLRNGTEAKIGGTA